MKRQLEDTKKNSSIISVDAVNDKYIEESQDGNLYIFDSFEITTSLDNAKKSGIASFKSENKDSSDANVNETFRIKAAPFVHPDQIQYEDKKYEFICWAREKFALKEKKKSLSFFEVDEAVKATTFTKVPCSNITLRSLISH